MNSRIVLITALVVVGAIATAQVARTRFEARLTGSTAAKGKAKYDTRAGKSELQIEGENLVAGANYTVQISDRTWSSTANALRTIRIVQTYPGTTGPAIAAGTPVRVFNDRGDIIMSGSFARR